MYIDWLFLQGFDPGELQGEESDDSDDEGKYYATLLNFVINTFAQCHYLVNKLQTPVSVYGYYFTLY